MKTSDRPFIILDRDGVINEDRPDYVKSPDEWIPIPGSLEAIAKLNQAGYTVVIVSNQSGLARGLFDREMLDKTHEKMMAALSIIGGKIEKIYICPHLPTDHCECRKPKIGLFTQIQEDFLIDLSRVFFIGDKYIDYLTAQNAGCRFILVKSGYGESVLLSHPELKNKIPFASNLKDAIDNIVLTKNT